MPQEGKRSIGYRPFISCDDPRGVVECGPLRKHKKSSELAQTPTTYQLLEVSRGAQKLNHVVSSWSCGHTNNNERDMAQDLLKGALDLGQSLAMLSRLQDSNNVYSDPSTSSSQSSIVHPTNCVSQKESFLSSKRKKKRPKGLNLIAKLMGLEDASLRKHVGERIVNQKKPAFDQEEHDPWKSGWKRRALDQMVEALKFKGNPKSPLIVRLSCLNMDHPIIPKRRAEVDEEMLLKMKIRTNPLAETDEFGKLNFHEKELVDTSPKGRSRPHKKQSVENKAEEAAQKVNVSRRRGENKRRTKPETHLKPKTSRGTNIDTLQSATTIPFLNNNQRYRDEHGEVDKICTEMESLLSLEESLEDSTTLAEDASQIEISVADYVDDDQSSPSETPLSSSNQSNNSNQTSMIYPNERGTTDHVIGSACSEDEKHLYTVCCTDEEVNYIGVTSTSYIGENKLKALLLSSPQFLNHVEELFNLNGNPNRGFLQETGNDIDHNDLNARMLLDCANELVEVHGSECCRACILLPSTHKRSCVSCYYTSLDQLVDEVCDGIEALKCYMKDDGDGHSTDNLLLLVKGDLRSGKMVTGVWDIGWRNAGSVGEIEEITRGVGELVLDGLIDEILVDLTM